MSNNDFSRELTRRSLLMASMFSVIGGALGGGLVTRLVSGAKGDPGTAGTNGIDGSNGTDGVIGKDGTSGTNGTNGRNGTNGTDGGAASTVLRAGLPAPCHSRPCVPCTVRWLGHAGQPQHPPLRVDLLRDGGVDGIGLGLHAAVLHQRASSAAG